MNKCFLKNTKNNKSIQETKLQDLGKRNKKNPLKITSNTALSNPVKMASSYMYNKEYTELTNTQQAQLYEALN